MASGKTTSGISGALSGAMLGTQIAPGYGTAIGAAIGGLGGFMGGQDDESSKYYDEMMARVSQIQVPGMDQLTFTPEELQYMGDFTPDQLQNYVLEKSKMEGVAVDPRLKQEQMKALDKISQLADQGFSDEDMMGFNIARQQAAGEAEAKQNQILQNMQQRGQGGSGAELAARLMSNQASSNQLSLEQQKQAIAQAEARKAALAQLASQSGQMRSQDFGEQSAVAQAQDAVNRINQANQQDVARYNVGTGNQAGLTNLQTKQNISNQNVGIRNQGKQQQTQAAKDIFNMEMGKATGQNAISAGQASNSARQSANTNAGIGQIGQGLVQIGGSGAFKNLMSGSAPQNDEDVLDKDVSWMD